MCSFDWGYGSFRYVDCNNGWSVFLGFRLMKWVFNEDRDGCRSIGVMGNVFYDLWVWKVGFMSWLVGVLFGERGREERVMN